MPVVCVSSRTNNTASKTVRQMPDLCRSGMFHSVMLNSAMFHSAMFHSVRSKQPYFLFPSVHTTLRERIFYNVKCYKLTATLRCTTKKRFFLISGSNWKLIHLNVKIIVSGPVKISAILASSHKQYIWLIASAVIVFPILCLYIYVCVCISN